MKNEFAERLKEIEQELTDLKTATNYTSIKSSVESSLANATTGTYRITYNNQGEDIMSMFFSTKGDFMYPIIMPQTISDNTQIVQISTTYYIASGSGYTPVTDHTNLTIVSNVPIQSIVKIS